MRRFPSLRSGHATHGQIVFAGLLVEAALFGRQSGHWEILDIFTQAGRALRLPMTYHELLKEGLDRERMLEALDDFAHPGTLFASCAESVRKNNFRFLDNLFGSDEPRRPWE
jgi:hypothetical protein